MKTETWYKASLGLRGIEAVEVERESNVFVWVLYGKHVRQDKKSTASVSYFKSYEEAWRWINAKLEEDILQAKRSVEKAHEQLAEFHDDYPVPF